MPRNEVWFRHRIHHFPCVPGSIPPASQANVQCLRYSDSRCWPSRRLDLSNTFDWREFLVFLFRGCNFTIGILYGVQVNEHYLFHGTKKESLTKIHRQGLDFRVASDRTMLGPGVYASESSTKADQYTGKCSLQNSKQQVIFRTFSNRLKPSSQANNHPQPNQSSTQPIPSKQGSKQACNQPTNQPTWKKKALSRWNLFKGHLT